MYGFLLYVCGVHKKMYSESVWKFIFSPLIPDILTALLMPLAEHFNYKKNINGWLCASLTQFLHKSFVEFMFYISMMWKRE